MQKIDTNKIADGVRALIDKGSTLKQLRGVTNAELEAVYSLAFGYYQTGKYEEALKLFQFLVLFDHLNKKYWMGLGAVQQVLKDFQNAVVSYGYCSFLDLKNPKPQLHAAECFLAMGDKRSAASAIFALEEFCPNDTDIGREYRAKAAKLRDQLGEEPFAELAAEDEKLAKEKAGK
ncbi:MAG: CesD/SycD/LcrH family type III secretion system chaperone [Lentisphaerae bacterium]|jgi:type III secretion system low calcium response chaperone LcrH/SycD|nr:CesD/SycD/LcrH family type III secretion system chaperone [Lentisphaerota bacterium]